MSDTPNDPAARAAARMPWLLAGWAATAVLLIAAILVVLFTKAVVVGIVLFLLGAIGSGIVSLGLVRTRAIVRGSQPS